MGMKKKTTKNPGQSGKRFQSKEFGLLPLPPLANPFSSSRGATTEILWLPCVPTVIAVGTTSYAAALNITAASIANFSNWAANWEEYCIRALEWEYIACGSQNGVVKFYIDEADNSNPTATTAKAHIGWLSPCAKDSGYRKKVRWVAKDTGDETWRATSVTGAFVSSLKVYSDQTNYGLVGTSEAVAVVNVHACVQFRTQGGA